MSPQAFRWFAWRPVWTRDRMQEVDASGVNAERYVRVRGRRRRLMLRKVMCRLGMHSCFQQWDRWGTAMVCRYCPVLIEQEGQVER